jgi:putative hydrolase of the HAD superfamily
MGENNIEAIILDLGNVLIDFDHGIAAKKISALTGKTQEEIFNLFFDSELTAFFEEGKISPRDFFQKIKEILDLKANYNEFLPIWNEIFFLTEKNRSVYQLAKTLSKHYKVVLLSNINILHFEYLKENFPVFDAFHHIITSFEVGFRKPHITIYEKALEILNVPPERAFYADDRLELVEEANRLGIRSFLFKGADKLKEDCLSVGINLD